MEVVIICVISIIVGVVISGGHGASEPSVTVVLTRGGREVGHDQQ